MLAGPMDYTPGAFGNSNRENFVARNFMPMGLGTRAQELALYVVFESPFQMVSDYPEHYAGQKEFDFIKRVPATWDEVHAIGGQADGMDFAGAPEWQRLVCRLADQLG